MKQRKKQPVQTRQSILHCAGELFSRHGYAGTGLGVIVSNAELTKGALFHHFSDKRALAKAWIDEDLTAAMSSRWCLPLETIVSLEGFRSFCRVRCLEMGRGDAASALVMIAAETGEDPVLGPAFQNLFTLWRRSFAGLLDRGKTEGWIHRSILPDLEATFLVSLFSGFTVTTQCSPDSSVRRTCATALEGYLETLRAQ